MKKILSILLVGLFSVLIGISGTTLPTAQAANSDWTIVNPSGWTSGGHTTNNNLKFVNFNNSLLAIAGSNSAGGRVWKYNGSNNWSLIAQDAFGSSTGSNVFSAVVFNGKIYALVLNSCSITAGPTINGCDFLWSSADGVTWQKAAPANMGYTTRPLFSAWDTLKVFNDKLFVGFSPFAAGPSFGYLSDTAGGNWQQVFSSPQTSLTAVAVMGNTLYVGASGTSSGVTVYKSTDGNTWSGGTTFASSAPSPQLSLVGFNNVLYGAVDSLSPSNTNSLWTSTDGTTWKSQNIITGYDYSYPSFYYVAGQTLYIGSLNKTTGADLWQSTDGSTWVSSITGGVGITANKYLVDIISINSLVYAGFQNDNGDQVFSSSGATPATLEIKLPPTNVFTPKSLVIGGQTYTFSGGAFTPTTQGKLTVTTVSGTVAGYPSYDVQIAGFGKGNLIASTTRRINSKLLSFIQKANAQVPPASALYSLYAQSSAIDYRMTFNNPTYSAATNIASTLHSNPTKGTDDLFLSTKADCSDKDYLVGSYLCLRTAVSFSTPELPTVTKYLLQSINALPPGIIINGNVTATNTIGGFTFADPKSVAVGGTVTATGGQALDNYQSATSVISWNNVQNQLQNIFAQRVKGTTATLTTFGNANQTTWNLNSSSTSDPSNSNSNSFSTTPEGKLWNVDNGANGGITFVVPSGGLTFNGRGTIAVAGNVKFIGTSAINCTNGDFGLIASGSITFQNGLGPINCGAFVALGGDITMQQQITSNQSWNVIMVAKNNVVLPKIVSGNVTINYNSAFASNPTVLFTDVLKIIFVSN